MLNYENQLNLGNIYSECSELFKEQRPEFLNLMEQYLDIDKYISYQFKRAFYADTGRPRGCSLHGYISALILQKIFTIPTDSLLILILNFSSELRHFCGIDKVPDASKWTRFKQDFCNYLKVMFISLVDITEPICQAINPTLANMISYDTSSVEAYVSENNAKYINSCIRRLKSYFKTKGIQKSDDDIYKLAYSSMPKTASSDPSIRKMYSNGHFCYGRKFGIITNGLGIPRHIDFFDDEFKHKHKDFIYDDMDSPDYDKSLADNKSLKPMISDFYSLHPINSRATTHKPNCPFNENGIPVCPNDHSLPFGLDGISNEKGRARRQKWHCPKIKIVNKKRICTCENPCCSSKTGRVVYTYPDKNFRLYPGTLRGTDEWNKLYKIRNVVEQSINHIKTNMGIAGRKTRNALTTKADVLLAGIAQLFTVIIADALSKPQYIRSIKKLAC